MENLTPNFAGYLFSNSRARCKPESKVACHRSNPLAKFRQVSPMFAYFPALTSVFIFSFSNLVHVSYLPAPDPGVTLLHNHDHLQIVALLCSYFSGSYFSCSYFSASWLLGSYYYAPIQVSIIAGLQQSVFPDAIGSPSITSSRTLS